MDYTENKKIKSISYAVNVHSFGPKDSYRFRCTIKTEETSAVGYGKTPTLAYDDGIENLFSEELNK